MSFAKLDRRELFRLLGGVAAWPLALNAQPGAKIPRIGFLGAASPTGYAGQVAGFRAGLRDLGYIENTNVVLEFRWAGGKYERLGELAAELVRSDVDVIVTHGAPGSLAAKQATKTVPIVMAVVGDPVASGIVASLARPGGNITGQSFFAPELDAKRIELLKELIPHVTRIAVLVNPQNPAGMGAELEAKEKAARSLKLELQQVPLRRPSEIDSAFEQMEQGRAEAVAVGEDGMMIANAGAIAAAATKRRIVSIGNSELAQAGGLIGYGVDFPAAFRRAATFVDKILKGAKPADLPIEQATKFEFVVNLKTARALGIELPSSLLVRADQVIE